MQVLSGSTAIVAAGFMLLMCACSAESPPPAQESDPQARADELARRLVIVDTHIDVPSRLDPDMEDISVRTAMGDFDYPRARAGGLDAAFMSIYVPAGYQEKGGARQYAEKLIGMVEGFASRWPDKYALAMTPQDILDRAGSEIISLPMGMENGAPIEDDLANVAYFHDRGIRYITLTHSKDNQICDSSYTEGERTWKGLSPFGRQVVEEMNRVGVMIDVSHVSDEAFHQILDLSRAPAIASHSSCRKFTPGWERNMSDEMIVKLASRGGVIQINFGSAFLTQQAHEAFNAFSTARKEFREEQKLDPEDERLKTFAEEYWKTHPKVYASLEDVVAHIDHVVSIAGIDHVGLGSDFDGVGDSLPEGLKDVSGYPNLIRALLEKGYSEQDIGKITAGNLLRVWSQVEQVAREIQGTAVAGYPSPGARP